MDLQDETRMNDVYGDITNIINQIGKLPVFPPLVWVWTWDVALSTYRDFKDEPDYVVKKTIDEMWEIFWESADQNGFTLEFGTEDLYEAIRDWMIDEEIVVDAEDEEEEDE